MRWFFAGLLLVGAAVVAGIPTASAQDEEENVVEIVIDGAGFTPSAAIVPAGFGAAWCNDDDVVHSITFDGGGSSPDLDPGDCTDVVVLEPGSYPYHDGKHPETKATIEFQAPPTTTTTASPTTTIVGGPPTTARVTTTTRRTSTTRLVIRKATTTLAPTSSTEATTTTLFDTTTMFDPTTSTSSFGTFPINESGGGEGATVGIVLAGLAVLGGAGYLGYRYRFRFMR